MLSSDLLTSTKSLGLFLCGSSVRRTRLTRRWFAETLRGMFVSKDVAWKTMSHKDAEEQQRTGAWALLLPTEHVRKEVEIDVRTLQEKKKEAILARHRAASSTVNAGDTSEGTAGASASGAELSSAEPSGNAGTTPAWLLLLFH